MPPETPTGTPLYAEHFSRLTTIAVQEFHIPTDDAEKLAHNVLLSTLLRQNRISDLSQWLTGALELAAKHYLRGKDA